MIRLWFVLGAVLAANAQPAKEWDAREVEGFVDGLMEAQKNAYHFAGAVVVIVRNGQVSFEKGYGYADFEARRPVDPNRTLFRVASNTKMRLDVGGQLVEQGKLDLHTDINTTSEAQIPPTFGGPPLEHLMTHTRVSRARVSAYREDPDKVRQCRSDENDMPRRIFPPGKLTAYSNYGASLAALIVEQVAGVPFEEYVRTRILDPLGMKHATLAQPVPREMAADLSKGYRWTGGRLEEAPFEYMPWAPSGGMSASGEDMCRFMMAHLDDGALSSPNPAAANGPRDAWKADLILAADQWNAPRIHRNELERRNDSGPRRHHALVSQHDSIAPGPAPRRVCGLQHGQRSAGARPVLWCVRGSLLS
jgi:CubicO group peptidase (beta-lactamase class C family)